jgi:hypothetical protein
MQVNEKVSNSSVVRWSSCPWETQSDRNGLLSARESSTGDVRVRLAVKGKLAYDGYV